MTRPRPIVLKFGGESLSAPEEVLRLILKTRRRGTDVVVVASAREGVTDLLKTALRPAGDRPSPRSLVEELARLHPDLPPAGRRILGRVEALAARLAESGSSDRAHVDELLSQGERLAVHWLAARLRTAGAPVRPVEADRLGLLTDNSYGASRILLSRSQRRVRSGLTRILAAGEIPIVTGFFGRSLEGRVATLGRGGSDYSASAIGCLLGASRVELVKRHVAIFTADPRLVPNARPVRRLSYEEAEEFAQFGARVLHPVTIEPARAAGVELRVRSLHDDGLVTSIGPAAPSEVTRTVTRLGPLRLVSIRLAGGRQRQGILAAITTRLAEIHVTLAAVITTEAVIGLLVEPAEAARARRALREFARPAGAVLGRSLPVSLVSAVGEGILSELPRLPPEIISRSEGVLATARSISIVVPEDAVVGSLRLLHRTFVEAQNGRAEGRGASTLSRRSRTPPSSARPPSAVDRPLTSIPVRSAGLLGVPVGLP